MTFNFDPEFTLSLLFGFLGVIAFVVTFIRTGSIKESINNLCEVNNLKYDTVEKKRKLKHSQEFSETVDDYILNSQSNQLEKLPVPKNIQAEIQSYIDCALERALERFLPKVVSEDDAVQDYSDCVDILASLGEAMELAEEYREKFNLSPSASLSEIYSRVDKEAQEIKSRIAKLNELKKPVIENDKKES